MTRPLDEYRCRVDAGRLAPDPAQLEAVRALDRLYGALVAAGAPGRGWRRGIARLTRQPIEPTRGVYLWGSVGRGKTLMLDLLYGCLPFDDKLRQHFHRFMASVHEDLKRFRRHADPLELTADRLADRTRIICFDELVVTDIADAMILANLFSALFARGVTLAATSNIEPALLYEGGLQRPRFLPAIELIQRHTEVIHVGGELDYRLQFLEKADVYLHPSDDSAHRRLAEYFRTMASDDGDGGGSVDILNRPIAYLTAADGVIWFDFAQVCDGPRSQDDYIELSRLFQTVLVSDVPQFDSTRENQARRFIAMVDEFYDRRVKLIASAGSAIEELYRGTKLTHDFKRTSSRLQEMQSHDYLAAAHRA